MSRDLVTNLLQERRSRLVAATMGTIERSPAWARLTREERLDLREDVIDAVNGYHDVVLDLMKVLSDGHSLINDQAVEMIRDVHTAVASRG